MPNYFRKIMEKYLHPGPDRIIIAHDPAISREGPIAYDNYQEMAAAFDLHARTKPYNADYDRPAVMSLMPELAGKKVLDAGCGPGIYARLFAEKGATVTGIDISEEMIRIAKEKAIPNARFFVQNLEEPLVRFADSSFDLIVCPLVIDYIRDLEGLFFEFFRLLNEGGHLVFSGSHPFSDYLYFQPESYFDEQLVECTWSGFGHKFQMPGYRRPMQALINPLVKSGFLLEKILEPTPAPAFSEKDPIGYERLMRFPVFIAFRARKQPH